MENYNAIIKITEKRNSLLNFTKEELIGWEEPIWGWTKLNVDGSVIQPGSKSACGGLIRDWTGRTIVGFSMNIEICTITMAELWGIYVGVKLVSGLGIAKLVMESDSKCAMTLIQKMSTEIHGSSSLIRSIKELLVKMKSVEVRHIYRETNFCIDTLAKLGEEHKPRIKFWEQPLPCLFHHFFTGASNVKFSRVVVQ
ncbi:hypothetical protein HN873_050716 [Arachis hypogaea]|uniref:RNase H type-1 domain-containing protein n=1 Tax=Arachis hypogaea TaxID=3818 RepID=A0A444Z8T9_ARAHY|nr:hypothetical protein Ahy_B05g078965 [Arachis hypogaea]